VGTLFFLLLVFAALTPSLACLEPLIAWLQQSRGMKRIPAVIFTMAITWLAGIASVLSFNRWAEWFPFDWVPGLQGKTVFVVLDFVASNVLLPAGALLTSVFVGWRVRRSIVADELSETTPFGRKMIGWLLSYLCPLAIAAVCAANLF
jgi:neurotransmitter:Na+ symporter, NSS family